MIIIIIIIILFNCFMNFLDVGHQQQNTTALEFWFKVNESLSYFSKAINDGRTLSFCLSDHDEDMTMRL